MDSYKKYISLRQRRLDRQKSDQQEKICGVRVFYSHLCRFFTICKQEMYLTCSNFVCDSCQKAVLNELDLGPNIARNTALSENVFMMVVCIELRIPLFVVGKPGSSKSLAKTVVADNMQGDAARSQLFKTFKQVI